MSLYSIGVGLSVMQANDIEFGRKSIGRHKKKDGKGQQFEVRYLLTRSLKGVYKKWAKVWVPGIQSFPFSSVDPEARVSCRLGTIWIMIISISHASSRVPEWSVLSMYCPRPRVT